MADTDSKPSTVDKAVDKVTDAFKDMKSHLPTSSNPDDQVPQTGMADYEIPLAAASH